MEIENCCHMFGTLSSVVVLAGVHIVANKISFLQNLPRCKLL